MKNLIIYIHCFILVGCTGTLTQALSNIGMNTRENTVFNDDIEYKMSSSSFLDHPIITGTVSNIGNAYDISAIIVFKAYKNGIMIDEAKDALSDIAANTYKRYEVIFYQINSHTNYDSIRKEIQ